MTRNKTASYRQNETHREVADEEISAQTKGASDGKATPQLPWPIEMLPPHRLRPAQRNARTHSKKQIRELADAVARFKIINPLVADDNGRIIAGHARAEAAKLLGLKQIPVIRVSHAPQRN